MTKYILLLSLISLPVFANKVRTVKVDLKELGVVNVLIKYTSGEPHDVSMKLTLEHKCKNSPVAKLLVVDLEACEYDGAHYSAAKKELQLKYRVSELNAGGMVDCTDKKLEAYPISCP